MKKNAPMSAGQFDNILSKIRVYIPPLNEYEARKVLEKKNEKELELGIKNLIYGLSGAIFFEIGIGGRRTSLRGLIGELGLKQKITIYNDYIDEWNPFVSGGVERKIILVLFPIRGKFTLEKAMRELEDLGFRKPTPEDAVNFLAQYPENRYTVAFPHEPWLNANNKEKYILYSSFNGPEERYLSLKPIKEIGGNCIIAGVC